MSRGSEKGSFAAAIPEDVIAEAVAAVEKHPPARASTPDGAGPTLDTSGDGPVRPDRAEAEAPPDEPQDALRAQLSREHDLRLRALADLENLRKRMAREQEEAQRVGIERLALDLLPALDNLDRALAAAPEGPVADGVAMTRRLLDAALARHGVRSFSAERGAVFDPRVHQAVLATSAPDLPPGTVVSQELKGYWAGDRLLRPASVVVAAPPREA